MEEKTIKGYYEQMSTEELEQYAYDYYGIIYEKEYNTWLFPLNSVNTNNSIYLDCGNIVKLDFTGFAVNDNDTIIIQEIEDAEYTHVIQNITQDTEGCILWNGSLSDDGCYYLTNKVANMFRDYDNVEFVYYLDWTEDRVRHHIKGLEEEFGLPNKELTDEEIDSKYDALWKKTQNSICDLALEIMNYYTIAEDIKKQGFNKDVEMQAYLAVCQAIQYIATDQDDDIEFKLNEINYNHREEIDFANKYDL